MAKKGRKRSTKKNITKELQKDPVGTSIAQYKKLKAPGKGVVLALAAGLLGGTAAVNAIGKDIPIVGGILAQIAGEGARWRTKIMRK